MKSPIQTLLIVKGKRKRRSLKPVKTRRSLNQVSLSLLVVILVVLAILPIIAGYFYTQFSSDLPSVEWIPTYLDPEDGILLSPTVLMDNTGENEIYRMEETGGYRQFLSLDPNQTVFISPYVVQMTVVVYQPDFWTSPGYNTKIFSQDSERTIAESLVEKLLLWNEPESLSKTIRMRLLAAQVTKKYGKAQVLEWFINCLSFGHHTIGIDSAARVYLQKNANELDLAESALLVSVSQSPALNPLDAPQAALEIKDELLRQLFTNELISLNDYQLAIETDIELVTEIQASDQFAPAYSNLVIRKMEDLYGSERVELGGLTIITGLDIDIQNALQCTTLTQMKRLNGNNAVVSDCEAVRFLPALFDDSPENLELLTSGIVLNPKNGQVLALVENFNGEKEISARSIKQGGSILTPLIAVNAFARGFSPATQVWDIPASLPANLEEYQLPIKDYKGPVRLRTALANDYQAAINDIFEQIGVDIVLQNADSFGLTTISDLKKTQDIFYEGESTSILEVADLYSLFSSLGTRYGIKNSTTGMLEPVLVEEVRLSDGRLLDQFTIESQSILSSELAYLTHDVLQDDYERQITLGYPNLLDLGIPSGGKFGSTFNKDEVWTAGYTPQYVTVIWMGQTGEEKIALNSKVTGGIWYAMMQWLHQDLPVEDWQQPSGIKEVVVCNLSGMLPTRECPNTITEKFIDGTQPTSYDNLFASYEINRETGLLATVFTPPEMIEAKTFMLIPEDAQQWAEYNNIETPPTNYDLIQSPTINEDVLITSPENYDFVNGVVDILGTVQVSDMSSYRIQIGYGLNPSTWLQIGEEGIRKINNKKITEWDTNDLDDGLYALQLQVVHENYQVETFTIQVSVDNTAPTARILYPTDGHLISISSQGTMTLQAEVSDNTSLERVEWWLDGVLVGTSFEMPYSYPIKIDTGKHSVFVKAYDKAGNESISNKSEFEVN